MTILDKFRQRGDRRRHRGHTGERFIELIENYLDPMNPRRGTYGDQTQGVHGKAPGEGGSTAAEEGLG
jgi:hypothetical protein